ncbi:MAG: phosphopantetheine-binding protein [Planctomycetota bacterium]
MATREQVFEVVKTNMIDILEVEPSRIDAERSMAELGATSLDIVEVVSCSMRELRVKVPRSALSKLTNINGLVDLLWAATRGEVVATT